VSNLVYVNKKAVIKEPSIYIQQRGQKVIYLRLEVFFERGYQRYVADSALSGFTLKIVPVERQRISVTVFVIKKAVLKSLLLLI
jgi:hypothetical protein